MNVQQTFTTLSRRTLFALLLAASLALTTIFGQVALSNLIGVTLATTAHACEGHTGGC